MVALVLDFYAKRENFVSLYKPIFSQQKSNKWSSNTKIFSITKKVKMQKLSCVIYGKYRKFEKSKILYILEKTVFSITCSNCENEDAQIF